MKRGKKQPTSTQVLRFMLHAGSREIPKNTGEFTGYYRGDCTVLVSSQFPHLANQTVSIVLKNMVSMSSAFIYETHAHAYINGKLVVEKDEFVMAVGAKELLCSDDVAAIMDEITTAMNATLFKEFTDEDDETEGELPMWNREPLNDLVRAVSRNGGNISRAELLTIPSLEDILWQVSDVARLPLLNTLIRHFAPHSVKEQRAKIRSLTRGQLETLVEMLKRTPWFLVFREPLKSDFNGIKPLSSNAYYDVCRGYRVQPEGHVSVAMRLYFAILAEEHTRKHTRFESLPFITSVFSVAEYAKTRPTFPSKDEWIAAQVPIWAFLEEHKAIKWLNEEHTTFALMQHYRNAKTICRAFERCVAAAEEEAPVLRTGGVPMLPPILTKDQCAIFQHILDNPISVVEGLPGTGKTSIIEKIMSHFANVMLVTLTGMMTKSLQKRNGNHVEAAHTIHSVICNAQYAMGGKEWAAKFDVLVVDEVSNTAANLFCKLLKVLPNLKRIIVVGDYAQIRSIAPGDPLGDFRNFFGSQMLTEILRVDPKLRDLAEAPRIMLEKHPERVAFNPKGPVSLIPKMVLPGGITGGKECYKATLKPIIADIIRNDPHLLNFQMVCLENKTRHMINSASQELLVDMRILSRTAQRFYIGSLALFKGCKITFLKNYNKPIDRMLGGNGTIEVKLKGNRRPKGNIFHSDPIANGELGIILDIRTMPDGFYITFTDSADQADAQIKTVICSNVIPNAVSLFHIDLGYATTTTKVQGREFPRVIFWNNTDPWYHWTLPHAYVAISRGKKRVWVIGTQYDFEKLCRQPEPPRSTVCFHLLQTRFAALKTSDVVGAGTLNNTHDGLRVLPKKTPCVPTLADTQKELMEAASKSKRG